MMEDFKKRFDAILIDKLSIRHDQITPEARFMEDLGADSLDVAELIVEIEREFDISISDEEADEFRTVREAECYLRGKLKLKRGSVSDTIL